MKVVFLVYKKKSLCWIQIILHFIYFIFSQFEHSHSQDSLERQEEEDVFDDTDGFLFSPSPLPSDDEDWNFELPSTPVQRADNPVVMDIAFQHDVAHGTVPLYSVPRNIPTKKEEDPSVAFFPCTIWFFNFFPPWNFKAVLFLPFYPVEGLVLIFFLFFFFLSLTDCVLFINRNYFSRVV